MLGDRVQTDSSHLDYKLAFGSADKRSLFAGSKLSRCLTAANAFLIACLLVASIANAGNTRARGSTPIGPAILASYLKSSNMEADDRLGSAVALSANTLVVGAPGEDGSSSGDGTDNSAPLSGAAYVFARSGSGTWSQTAYLKATNAGNSDQFGSAVAISGGTIVVGAIFEDSASSDPNDNSANAAGAAYVFVRDGKGGWRQQAYLKASNAEAGDRFGYSVAVSGDTIAVGAIGEASGDSTNPDDNSATRAGAVYVFARDGDSWAQQDYLKADNIDSQDEFGFSVDMSGPLIVVGAPNEDGSATGVNGQEDNLSDSAGAAYLFEKVNDNDWIQAAYLKASNSQSNDRFGSAVAISATTVVVSAPDENRNATGVGGEAAPVPAIRSGAAYVFELNEVDDWAQSAYLKASNTDTQDRFGVSVAASGDLVIVGAPFEDGRSGGAPSSNVRPDSGAAYVYARQAGGDWVFDSYYKALNPGSGDAFGSAVDINGDIVVAAAVEEDGAATSIDGDQFDNSAEGAGAVYAYRGLPWIFADRFER